MDLLLEERATVGMVSFSQTLDNVAKVLAHPAIMIGSDSIGLSEGVGPQARQAAPAHVRDVPARARRVRARPRALLAGDRGAQDDGHAGGAAPVQGPRAPARRATPRTSPCSTPPTVKDEATFQDPAPLRRGNPLRRGQRRRRRRRRAHARRGHGPRPDAPLTGRTHGAGRARRRRDPFTAARRSRVDAGCRAPRA